MTPLTEQKSMNLHDETAVCDQVQHFTVQSCCWKTAVYDLSGTGSDVRDKMLVKQTCITNTCRFDMCEESVEIHFHRVVFFYSGERG